MEETNHTKETEESITPQKPEKNLNGRIEDLVNVMEKTFSLRASFVRGIFQGLGFIIGSTIIAGIAYSVLTQFVSPRVLHDMSFDAMLEKTIQ